MKNVKLLSNHYLYFLCFFAVLQKSYAIKDNYLNEENISSFIFPDDGKKLTIEEKLKKYEGTFQIQVKDVRFKPNIPYNIDELIEENRKQSETVYITLGSAVRLKILSLDEIKNNTNKKADLISTF